jgi:hypothetical protein
MTDSRLSYVAFDRKQYSRKYYELNREKILLYQKQYYRKTRKPRQKPHFEIRHGKFVLFGVSGLVVVNAS